jgi:hypothetical protein
MAASKGTECRVVVKRVIKRGKLKKEDDPLRESRTTRRPARGFLFLLLHAE